MKRAKKTYITFALRCETASKEFRPTVQSIKHEILNNLALLFGQFNHLRLSKEFNVLYYNSTSNYGIVQANNDYYQEILCCIFIIRNLAKQNVKVDIIHIGRTLKKCKRVIVNSYLDSLESCFIHEKIYGNSGDGSVDSAVETLKSMTLLPH